MGDTHSLYNPLLGSKIGSTKVELSDFHICDHTLTNVEWWAITGEPLNGNPNEPKTNVTWHDVYDFLSSLTSRPDGISGYPQKLNGNMLRVEVS